MKYIIISVKNNKESVKGKRSIPIIFPECLNHSDVFRSIKKCIIIHCYQNSSPLYMPEILSAGFVSFKDNTVICSGYSESLGGIKSRQKIDSELISNYETHKEAVKSWEYC